MAEECEICGREEAVYYVFLEGAKLNACAGCAQEGRIISKLSKHKNGRKKEEKKEEKTEVELVSDFAERIKKAREKMGLPRAVVAELLNEKESFLERIEAGKTTPNEKLAQKIEKMLKIKLFEEVVNEDVLVSKGKKELTLTDVVKLKRKE